MALMTFSEAPLTESVQEQWLDKLWLSLFDGSSGGLMSPGQIRREHRNRQMVRQLEMSAILDAEQELNDIHNGVKALDDGGNVVATPEVDKVETHQIIENTAIEQHLDIGLDTPEAMIRSVVKEVSVRDLERSLNLRKIAILAESEIFISESCPISALPVNAEWMIRWRESAETVFNPEMQVLWARVLVLEVAHPGRFTLGILATLLQLSGDDLEMVRIMAKYAFPDFIYCGSTRYFDAELHDGMFDVMEDLGLLSANTSEKVLRSKSSERFELLLPCRSKALKITLSDPTRVLALPVLKLTRVGKQVLLLCDDEADLAYLFDLANTIKDKGFDVALGDYQRQGTKEYFTEKMAL